MEHDEEPLPDTTTTPACGDEQPAPRCTRCKSPKIERRPVPGRKLCPFCAKQALDYMTGPYRAQHAVKQRAARQKVRMAAFEAYGGARCACCGEDHEEFLSIDHIDGGGAEHRRALGSASGFIYWLRKNNYPTGFRVLCMNCNFSLGVRGYCPHAPRDKYNEETST